MRQIEIYEGDIFCSAGGGIGVIIREYTDNLDPDGQSDFSHAGVLVDRSGRTFEARNWGVGHYHLDDYVGTRVLLGRHINMTRELFLKGYKEIEADDGKVYPFHRLLFHLVPPLARWIATGRMLVCSEETTKFLVNSVGFPTRHKSGKGIAPWYLADAIRRWDDYEEVIDGVYGVEWSIIRR